MPGRRFGRYPHCYLLLRRVHWRSYVDEARRDEGRAEHEKTRRYTRRISYVVSGGDEGRGGTHYAQSSFFRLYALNWFVR